MILKPTGHRSLTLEAPTSILDPRAPRSKHLLFSEMFGHLKEQVSEHKAIVLCLCAAAKRQPKHGWILWPTRLCRLGAQCQRQGCCIPAPYTLLPPGYPILWRTLVGHICTSKSHQARTQLCLLQLSGLFPWQVSPQQDSGLSPPAMASQDLVKIWVVMSMSAHPLHNSHFCCLWAQTCSSWILTAHPVPALRKCKESYTVEHWWNFR